MRLLPNIRYGTENYPEKVARRLRALNITAWIAAVVAGGYAVVQFFDSTPGVAKVAAINALAAPMLAATPLLHRFGPLAGPCSSPPASTRTSSPSSSFSVPTPACPCTTWSVRPSRADEVIE